MIPPLVGGIRFEYAHRVVAGLVSILTLVLAVWLSLCAEPRPVAKRLGWTALHDCVIAQAALGGVRVLVRGIPRFFGHGSCRSGADFLHHG